MELLQMNYIRRLGDKMLYIKQPKLIESSGICRSVTTPGVYYSHNDSGSAPVLYGFNELGEAAGLRWIE